MNTRELIIMDLRRKAKNAGIKIPPLFVGLLRRLINREYTPIVVTSNLDYEVVFDTTLAEAGNDEPFIIIDVADSGQSEMTKLALWMVKYLELQDALLLARKPCILACIGKLEGLEYNHLIEHVHKALEDKKK